MATIDCDFSRNVCPLVMILARVATLAVVVVLFNLVALTVEGCRVAPTNSPLKENRFGPSNVASLFLECVVLSGREVDRFLKSSSSLDSKILGRIDK